MSLITLLFSAVLAGIDYLFQPIFWYRSRNKRQLLPPIRNEHLMISASTLAENIRCKHLTSEAVCKAYIDRIKEVNVILNAVVEERFAKALIEAREVDKYVASASFNLDEVKELKPLLGVPVTIKESCSLSACFLETICKILNVGNDQQHGNKLEQLKQEILNCKSSKERRKI